MSRSLSDPEERESSGLADAVTAGELSAQSDAELCAAIRQGDEMAFGAVYARHRSFVTSRARMTCGENYAEEVVQEVFLRLWREPERFEPRRGSLRTFLDLQARGRAVDMARRDSARKTRELNDHVRSVQGNVDVALHAVGSLTAREIHHHLTALPEGERAAIALAYFGGHTYVQVASLLGVPEGTIKGRIRSGLRRLRDLLATGLVE